MKNLIHWCEIYSKSVKLDTKIRNFSKKIGNSLQKKKSIFKKVKIHSEIKNSLQKRNIYSKWKKLS